LTNILISGISGFVASHLAEALLEKGFDVYGTVRVVYTLRLTEVPEGAHMIHADLLDLHSLKKAIRLAQPDYIYHLAACSPVKYSFGNPLLYVNTNFVGTCNLVEAVLETSVKRLIVASSAEIYGEQGDKLLTEDDPPSAKNTPYGVTKIATDFWIRMAGDVYGLPYTLNRSTNMYGPRTRQRVVEKIIESMLTKNEVTMDGRPDIIRDFMYVKDGVQAYMACMDPKAENQVFNFSTGVGTSVEELVNLCRDIIGFKGKIAFATSPRPTDPSKIVLSYEKAKRILGWEPKYTLKQGLTETINWWRTQAPSQQRPTILPG
jgi:UDP-glucose 4-epimerase